MGQINKNVFFALLIILVLGSVCFFFFKSKSLNLKIPKNFKKMRENYIFKFYLNGERRFTRFVLCSFSF